MYAHPQLSRISHHLCLSTLAHRWFSRFSCESSTLTVSRSSIKWK
jgi:hypothetical protein